MTGEAGSVAPPPPNQDDEQEELAPPALPPTVLNDAQLASALAQLAADHSEEGKRVFGAFRHHPKKRAYLVALALTGVKMRATSAAGVDRTLPFYWRQEDKPFRDAELEAIAMSSDVLEAEIHRRAVEGVVRATGWYKGKPGGLVREYSDLLLIFAAKGAMPDKYKDRLEVRGMFANLDMTKLSDEQIDRIANGESPLVVLGTAAAKRIANENENGLAVKIGTLPVETEAEGSPQHGLTALPADENA